MITLRVGNSYSQITGLDSTQHKKLRAILSYDIDSSAAYFSNNRFNTKRYLIDNKGVFPTGLWPMVKTFIQENALKCSTIDDRKIPTTKVPLKGSFSHKPYKAQLEACKAAIKHHQATLSLPTGAGKSMVIALIINELKVKTLIIVPNLELKKQLTESLLQTFGSMKYITVENIDSSRLETMTNYDCLIIDEAHHSAAKTYQVLNKKAWGNIYYRIFLTATPFRNNTDETLLFQAIAGEVRFKLDYQTSVKEGYIVPVEAYYIEIPKYGTNAYSWAEVYSELVVNHAERNQMIANLLIHLSAQGYSTLCLVKEIKHGMILSSLSGAPFANGQDEESRQFIGDFNQRKVIGLIGTNGIIGEGVDSKPAEFCIIAGLGKAKSAFMQQVGRAIRTYPGKESAKIIIIKDKSHKFTLRHFNEQKKILLDYYGVEVVKLDI